MPEYASALRKAVSDPDGEVGAAARRALSRLDRTFAARSSIAVLLTDDRPAKLQVIAGLVDGGAESAVATLAQVLARDPDEDCRAAAARGLGHIGSGQGQAALTSACADQSAPVRMEAARALGVVGDQTAVAALTGLLDDDPTVVTEALASLGRLRLPESLPGVARCLEASSAEVRAAAATALGQLRHPLASATLAGALQDPDGQVRLAAARALARAAVPE